ncbi:hypothetical protein [Adhaeribacter soli]|uniref:Uncharacterized protein n=1 Tax=Adhaeribacter soli TaxID=2607655 RepID=A0A5N1IPS0_9BACT|nr:hypothetical protein [Adhaeribacter soli]KAA9331961.1 hypothetical protein F0P94_14295 [Adhaeribacter soli]
MKKIIIYTLAAMLVLPAVGSEPTRDPNTNKTVTISKPSLFGKKKPKVRKMKKKYVYRPGARQN